MKLFSWLQEEQSLTDGTGSDGDRPLAPALARRLQELRKIPVKDIMVPRALIHALDADVQLKRVRRLKSSKAHAFPVYKGDLDHILGWISKARVLELLNEPGEDSPLAGNLMPVGSIFEEATAADLADSFLKVACPFVVVKNHQGGTVGIVPLTEFVELLFGLEIDTPSLPMVNESPVSRAYEL